MADFADFEEAYEAYRDARDSVSEGGCLILPRVFIRMPARS